jgi:HK97 family phage portal protein
VLGNLGRGERRSISYQDVWSKGNDWHAEAKANNDALALSAVIACVNLRANTIAQLPLKAYRLGPDGLPVELARQPQLIEAPSKGPRSYWLRQMSISRDIFGNAFGMVVGRDAAGWPTAVEWLDPTKVATKQQYAGGPMDYTFKGQPVAEADIIVVPGFPVPGSPLGISPLQRSGLVELSSRAQAFGADWFKNGAVPSAILYADTDLDAEQAERIRASVQASWRKRRPAVLGSGLRWEKVSTSDVNESQALATMRHAQVDICQIFGVPPEMIGIASSGQSITYQNRESQQQAWLINGVNADLVLLQEILTANLPRPQFARFNTGALLRSDLMSRYSAYSTALGAGFLSVSEVRELEDRGPLPADMTPPGGATSA